MDYIVVNDQLLENKLLNTPSKPSKGSQDNL